MSNKLRWYIYHYCIVTPVLKCWMLVDKIYKWLEFRDDYWWYLAFQDENKEKALKWLRGLDGADDSRGGA